MYDSDLKTRSKSLKEIQKEQSINESEELFHETRLEIVEILLDRLPPLYKEIFELMASNNVIFVVSPRNCGKTYNATILQLCYCLLNNVDGASARKKEGELKKSIHRSMKLRIRELLPAHLSNYFKITEDEILFKIGSHEISFLFMGGWDADNFRSLEGRKFLHCDEITEFSQKDFGVIKPSIRDEKDNYVILLTSNIPEDGKKSWLYNVFFGDNVENGYLGIQAKHEDNPFFWNKKTGKPDKEKISLWKKGERAMYWGSQKAYEREIEGIWHDGSEYRVLRDLKIEESCPFGDGDDTLVLIDFTAGFLYAVAVKVLYEEPKEVHAFKEYMAEYNPADFLNWIQENDLRDCYIYTSKGIDHLRLFLDDFDVYLEERFNPHQDKWWHLFTGAKISADPSLKLVREQADFTSFEIGDSGGLSNKIKEDSDKGEPFALRALSLGLIE